MRQESKRCLDPFQRCVEGGSVTGRKRPVPMHFYGQFHSHIQQGTSRCNQRRSNGLPASVSGAAKQKKLVRPVIASVWLPGSPQNGRGLDGSCECDQVNPNNA